MNHELFTLDFVKQRHRELSERAHQDRLADALGFQPFWKRLLKRFTGRTQRTDRDPARPTEIAI